MNVKRITISLAISLTALVFGLTPSAQAQTRVALVDIGAIFKNHPTFSKSLAELKTQADQFKAETEKLQMDFAKRAEQLNFYEKDSPEYRELESKLARDSAALEVQQRGKMRDLLAREARLHYDTYLEVQRFIGDYCQEQGIQLVLRYSAQPMLPDNPNTIMQKVNGNVVYYRDGKDITSIIIERIMQVRSASNPPNSSNR